jgi:uncharacterized protein YcbK (DUF882 family)
MKVSKYFEQKEFDCNCGCSQTVHNTELFAVLDDVREHFGVPVIINSGKRCEAYNKKVGGVPKSQHVEGIAADIVVRGVSPDKVHAYLIGKYPTKYGIGKYNSFTHIDVRRIKARWDFSKE